jgi:hypothetical protein
MKIDITYPTVNLFVYDLRDGLGQTPKEIGNNKEQFLTRLPEGIRTAVSKQDIDIEAEYVELLGDKRKLDPPLKPIETFHTPDGYEGYYYPVRLGDTYGLLLDCSINQTLSTDYFGNLKAKIDSILNNQPGTIGQTWMLTAQLTDTPNIDPETIAKKCYQAFMGDRGDWNRDFLGKGNLIGGHIFELWLNSLSLSEEDGSYSSENKSDSSIQSGQTRHHVIIALYPDDATHEKASAFNFSWMRLFCYRHKIMFASRQSRYFKKELKKNYVCILDLIRKIRAPEEQTSKHNQGLRELLREAQFTLSEYSINISFFDAQIRNIEINVDNYEKRSDYLQTKAQPSTLEFLENFRDYVRNKSLPQIKKDYDNLSPGLKLLEGLVKSIDTFRIVVEFDDQERTRHYQKNVAIAAASVGSASLFTSASILSAQYAPHIVALKEITHWPNFKRPEQQKTDLPYAGVVLSLSLLIAFIFGFTTHQIIKTRRG